MGTESFVITTGYREVGRFDSVHLMHDCSSYSIGGIRLLPTDAADEEALCEALLHGMLGVITDIDEEDLEGDGANRYVFTYEGAQDALKTFLDYVCEYDCVSRHDMRTTGWRGNPLYFTILTIPKDFRCMNLGEASLWANRKELKIGFSTDLCNLDDMLNDIDNDCEEW